MCNIILLTKIDNYPWRHTYRYVRRLAGNIPSSSTTTTTYTCLCVGVTAAGCKSQLAKRSPKLNLPPFTGTIKHYLVKSSSNFPCAIKYSFHSSTHTCSESTTTSFMGKSSIEWCMSSGTHHILLSSTQSPYSSCLAESSFSVNVFHKFIRILAFVFWATTALRAIHLYLSWKTRRPSGQGQFQRVS